MPKHVETNTTSKKFCNKLVIQTSINLYQFSARNLELPTSSIREFFTKFKFRLRQCLLRYHPHIDNITHISCWLVYCRHFRFVFVEVVS